MAVKYKMVNCRVLQYGIGNVMNSLTIFFTGNNKDRSLYIDKNHDVFNFGVECEIIKAPTNWDGSLETLDRDWRDIDWGSITSCPEKYEEQAIKRYKRNKIIK